MAKLQVLSRFLGMLPKLSSNTSEYSIAAGYRHRRESLYFDDTALTDEWQKEVYESAADLMKQNDLRTVCDVGCGSGYKLVHFLGQYDTVGIDLSETIDIVKSRYPDRKWIGGNFETIALPQADLVIASDVIEHVPDPDALMHFVVKSTTRWMVVSTPDRDLIYKSWFAARHYYGPPKNPTHLREWTMAEFRRYVGRFATVVRHEISNQAQGTQMIVAEVKN